jgi:hypothetical protein
MPTHWRVKLGRMRRQLTMSALGVLPRRTMRVVPGTSQQFGPPRRWANWDDYRQRFGAEWIPIVPAMRCRYPRPKTDGALAERLWRDDWPEMGLAVLENARVLGAEGWPVGERDTLLIDLATGLERPEYTAFLIDRCRLDPSRTGTALNLASCYARENYCHFLLDALPRLELFLRSGLSYDDVDWVLVPDFFGSSRDAFYRALGIPEAKIVRLQPRVQYRFSRLYQPSFPGRECFVAPWVAEFYQKRLLEPHSISRVRERRLYVARSQRGLANDADVWAALRERGFERVEPLTWEDNVRAFASADVVVGPHGAGLSNVIFCPAGARVIELVPGDRPFPYFYTAACAAGADYRALLATPLARAGQEYRKLPSDEPYAVDVAALCAAVDTALAEGARLETFAK